MSYLYSIISGITDLVYPRVCLACRKRRAEARTQFILCSRCERCIVFSAPPFCLCCGRQLEKPFLHKTHCRACRKADFAFDRAFSPCIYTGVIRELIHEFKYAGKDYLGPYLGRLMADFITDFGICVGDFDYIVPVPLHPARLREREFNQAELLAHAAAQFLGVDSAPGLLLRPRMHKTQARLAARDRAGNLRGCFAAAPQARSRIAGRRILLIDDVMTSGSTASDAARALKSAGAAVVWILTLAH